MNKVLKVVIIISAIIFLSGCEDSGTQNPDNVSDIITLLKDGGIPIQYDIIYDSLTDPNGPEEHEYIEKGNFSDSRIETSYSEDEPLSGTIEIFSSSDLAQKRVDYLIDLDSDILDSFPYRILSKNILLRLNQNYTKEQLQEFIDITDGQLIENKPTKINLNDLADSNNENSDSKPLTDFPLITYAEISSGKYNGQDVCIEAVIDKLHISKSSCSFILWYQNEQDYLCSDQYSFFDIVADSSQAVFQSAKNGDVIKFATTIFNDGSFGPSSLYAAQVNGRRNLDEIYTAFKNNCPEMAYEDMQRNPDNYNGSRCKFSGTVFQIIKEDTYSAEYLISTDYGYVYLNWYDNENVRGTRLLENDNVTIFGEFELLKTYETLTGENTVPQISAKIIDLNN